jgi:hypothetical protein
VVVKAAAGPFPKRARLASISTRSSSRALATLKDGALASPETERTGPLPSQQNDLDLTWDQDLDRSFASEKDDDPDLIPDHDLKPGMASSLPPPCPPLPDDCGYKASHFRLCPICFKKWYYYRVAACLYCKTDPANKQRLSDIMTYRANMDYEFMMCETEEEN